MDWTSYILMSLFLFVTSVSPQLLPFNFKDPEIKIINAQNVEIGNEDNTITCRCNICTDTNFCFTNGACYLITKFSKNNERVYTQGCIDSTSFDDLENPYFCRINYDYPSSYKRECCFNNLCNGNETFPYQFQEIYSNENIFLLASVCGVIFLTLIAFILFFTCRFDLR